MGLRMLTRNRRHVTKLYGALSTAKGHTPSTDAYKRLITTIAPAAATSSNAHESSNTARWHLTCWAAAGAALIAGTTTVAFSEAEAVSSPPSADEVKPSFIYLFLLLPASIFFNFPLALSFQLSLTNLLIHLSLISP